VADDTSQQERLDELTEEFAGHRETLFSVAYQLLGSVSETEDVLQETWLAWAAAPRDDVQNARAYLVRITVNQALDRLGRAYRRRETYPGPWLPEPLVDDDASESAVKSEQVSLALLVVLETLSPLERAVFVLREAFGYPHEEIARMVGRNPAAVRQLARRAREHVRQRRTRYAVDPQLRRSVTENFMDAAIGGDVDALMRVLAPDVELWTDAGGRIRTARRVVRGRENVANLLAGIVRRGWMPPIHTRPATVNGEPGVLALVADELFGVAVVELTPEGDRVSAIYGVINPDKLQGVGAGV
jgi:RNA polymerase sigma factor (sigma-70 family)